MEELNYHVDFGPFYVHLTQKQKRYLAVRSVIDRVWQRWRWFYFPLCF